VAKGVVDFRRFMLHSCLLSLDTKFTDCCTENKILIAKDFTLWAENHTRETQVKRHVIRYQKYTIIELERPLKKLVNHRMARMGIGHRQNAMSRCFFSGLVHAFPPNDKFSDSEHGHKLNFSKNSEASPGYPTQHNRACSFDDQYLAHTETHSNVTPARCMA
jgi:hypothetical protein